MASKEQVTIGGLTQLGLTRGYTLVLKAKGCMLFSLVTRLPEPNEPRGGLLFTLDEAWDFLSGLQPNRGDPVSRE